MTAWEALLTGMSWFVAGTVLLILFFMLALFALAAVSAWKQAKITQDIRHMETFQAAQNRIGVMADNSPSWEGRDMAGMPIRFYAGKDSEQGLGPYVRIIFGDSELGAQALIAGEDCDAVGSVFFYHWLNGE